VFVTVRERNHATFPLSSVLSSEEVFQLQMPVLTGNLSWILISYTLPEGTWMNQSASTPEKPSTSAETPPAPVTFAEAIRFWIKLGFISFGGPAGQIPIMHSELVERRRWISERRFLHALNYCMLLPGPEAQQLAK
jgi:hypothetical protein